MDQRDILESLVDRWQRILRKRLEGSEELSSELVEDIIACALDQLRFLQPHGSEPMAGLWHLRQLQWTEIVYELVQGAAEELLSGNSLPQPASRMRKRRPYLSSRVSPEVKKAGELSKRKCLFRLNDRKEWRSMRAKEWPEQVGWMVSQALRAAE